MRKAKSYGLPATAGNNAVSGPAPHYLRPAELADIPALVQLEQRCFDSDRLTRRSFHWMLTRANATLLVAEGEEGIGGYVLNLYHRGTSLARIYSMAVSPEARGLGLGGRLLAAAEADARGRNCAYMRLEVRPDNTGAIALYERNGYRLFDIKDDYYEDHEPARRYEKRIHHAAPTGFKPAPFYPQTTEFTCGPAALMMAMRRLDPGRRLSPTLELQLWREATTIFMTSGHGGCGPHGLALAARRRGFRVEIYLNQADSLFIEGVRNAEKKRVIELVQKDFEAQIKNTDIALHRQSITLEALGEALEAGAAPIVLISSYRLTRSKAPHWVMVTGIDTRYVYVHDPEVDEENGKTAFDCMHVPIARRVFEQMTRFGSRRLRAAVLLYNSRYKEKGKRDRVPGAHNSR